MTIVAGVILALLVLGYPFVWLAVMVGIVTLSYPDPDVRTVRSRDALIVQCIGLAFLALGVALAATGAIRNISDLEFAGVSYFLAYLVFSYWSVFCCWRAACRHERRRWPLLLMAVGALPFLVMAFGALPLVLLAAALLDV